MYATSQGGDDDDKINNKTNNKHLNRHDYNSNITNTLPCLAFPYLSSPLPFTNPLDVISQIHRCHNSVIAKKARIKFSSGGS